MPRDLGTTATGTLYDQSAEKEDDLYRNNLGTAYGINLIDNRLAAIRIKLMRNARLACCFMKKIIRSHVLRRPTNLLAFTSRNP